MHGCFIMLCECDAHHIATAFHRLEAALRFADTDARIKHVSDECERVK